MRARNPQPKTNIRAVTWYPIAFASSCNRKFAPTSPSPAIMAYAPALPPAIRPATSSALRLHQPPRLHLCACRYRRNCPGDGARSLHRSLQPLLEACRWLLQGCRCPWLLGACARGLGSNSRFRLAPQHAPPAHSARWAYCDALGKTPRSAMQCCWHVAMCSLASYPYRASPSCSLIQSCNALCTRTPIPAPIANI